MHISQNTVIICEHQSLVIRIIAIIYHIPILCQATPEALKSSISKPDNCARELYYLSHFTHSGSQMLSNLPQVKQFINRWAWFQLSSPARKPTLLSLCVFCQAPESLRLSLSSRPGLHGMQRPVYPEHLNSVRMTWQASILPHWTIPLALHLHLSDCELLLTGVPSLLEATMSKSTHILSPLPTRQPAYSLIRPYPVTLVGRAPCLALL